MKGITKAIIRLISVLVGTGVIKSENAIWIIEPLYFTESDGEL